jgi:hypothetical protein
MLKEKKRKQNAQKGRVQQQTEMIYWQPGSVSGVGHLVTLAPGRNFLNGYKDGRCDNARNNGVCPSRKNLGCETWFLTLGEEQSLRVFENRC